MIKTAKFLALTMALALLIGALPINASAGVAAHEALASETPEASVSSGNATSAQTSMAQSMDEQGFKMELLWCAGSKDYDITNTDDLVPHAPETLEAGKFYELAIKVTNDTDEVIATPWGVDYAIVLPRVLTPEMSEMSICGAVHSNHRNDDADLSALMSANIEANEPIALRYVDFSNYTIRSGETTQAGFNWASDSNPLDDEKIVLQGTWQGFQPHTYKVVSFLVEARPLSEWEEFAEIMHQEPVRATISDVSEGMYWESNRFDNTMHRRELLYIGFTVNIPQWLRELTEKEGGWWRIMVRPRFSENGTIGVELRFENHNCAYVMAADQAIPEGCDTSKWLKEGYFMGATFDGCETYADAANWGGYGADCRWASLYEEDWGELLNQDEIRISLGMKVK